MKKIVFLIISFAFFNGIAMDKEKKLNLMRMFDIVTSKNSQQDAIKHITELLDQGVDINANLCGGYTALHYAVLNKKKDLAQFIIKRNGNPHIENCEHLTALELAARDWYGGDSEMEALLKSSSSTIFRPGMNRSHQKDQQNKLDDYNETFGLHLQMGEQFD